MGRACGSGRCEREAEGAKGRVTQERGGARERWEGEGESGG
jgi:hypothetical protein